MKRVNSRLSVPPPRRAPGKEKALSLLNDFLRRYAVPCFRMGWLARSLHSRGTGMGDVFELPH